MKIPVAAIPSCYPFLEGTSALGCTSSPYVHIVFGSAKKMLKLNTELLAKKPTSMHTLHFTAMDGHRFTLHDDKVLLATSVE